MSWHESYVGRVLEPDYRFAARHLAPHLLDALAAHLRTVADLPIAQAPAARAQIRAAHQALLRWHDRPLPDFSPEVPDAFFAVYRALEEELGAASAGWLRVGLSRNDLDMTVYKLRARAQALQLGGRLLTLRAAVLEQAERGIDTVLIAQTHHQPGQPTTVAHYHLAIAALAARDTARLLDAWVRLDTCPMGAAALAGSSHPLDRAATARRLGFAAPVENTYDAVAASDWGVELVGVAQSVALNASRLVCDLLAWTAAGWYRLPDALVQGSSIMPQKRNPVPLEHARARFSRAAGAAQMVAFSSHNIPFADLNDFGPDLQGTLQTQHTQLLGGLDLLHACVREGRFDTEALAEVAAATDTSATELADELVRRAGMDPAAAQGVVGRMVRRAGAEGRSAASLGPDDLEAAGGPRVEAEIVRDALDPARFVARRDGLGGPAPTSVRAQLTRAREALDRDRARLAGHEEQAEAARRELRTPWS
ncbi:MAG: lyase family protein [Trueperaceae bacterium]|nr:lyase family protein [Trueperaceae bacterium]